MAWYALSMLLEYHLPGSTGITSSFVLQDSDERFQNNLLPTTDLKPSSYPLNQFYMVLDTEVSTEYFLLAYYKILGESL